MFPVALTAFYETRERGGVGLITACSVAPNRNVSKRAATNRIGLVQTVSTLDGYAFKPGDRFGYGYWSVYQVLRQLAKKGERLSDQHASQLG